MSIIRALAEACGRLGMRPDQAELIRSGDNTIYRLPGDVVVRIGEPGTLDTARRETEVSRWLAAEGITVVRALDLDQPIVASDRPVTFWRDIGPHRDGTPREVAGILRTLHRLQAPPGLLPRLDLFARVEDRLRAAEWLPAPDQQWLGEHLAALKHRHGNLHGGLPITVVHGDARGANIVATADGDGDLVVLDLDRFALGPPEWDLLSTAHKLTAGWITPEQYGEFRDTYGYDVMAWGGYPVLRDIRELRETSFVAGLAADRQELRAEAQLRLACIRGESGPRPWAWTPV